MKATTIAKRSYIYAILIIILAFAILPVASLAQTHAASAQPMVTLPPPTHRIIVYNRIWDFIYFFRRFWLFGGLWIAIMMNVGAALRDLVNKITRRSFFRIDLYWAFLSFGILLWNSPINFAGYLIDRAYGFALQTPALWMRDQMVDWLFGFTTVIPIWLFLHYRKTSPRRGWIKLWFWCVPLLFVLFILEPVVFEPMFNHFKPLPPSPLRTAIEALAKKAGIPNAPILVSNVSIRTSRLNAYVTGIGPTARIVIWDNTLHELTQNQILAILGHEMGHYVLHHIWWSLLFAIIGSFFILGIHAWLVDKASERFKGRLHLLGRGDLAIIPMALLIFQLLVFLQTPIASAISRVEEHQADAFGLRLTHLNKAMAEDFVKFVVNDYADPNPPRFIVFWCYTHPPIRQRLDFVLHYNDGVKTPK